MAKLNPNTLIGALSGRPVGLVFVPPQGGSVIVKQRPVRKATDEGSPSLRVTNSYALAIVGVASGNRAPVVGSLTDRTVDAGQTIIFTPTATDTDVPAASNNR